MATKYEIELENIIMDDLIPMYLIGCRSSGIDPKLNTLLKKLIEARGLQREICFLLQNHEDSI
jgi:hypothetical protein